MRFESLTAHAFGPFRGTTFHLAPGFNVVFGPNEAGKSSLHAALYAALCGLRRGQGQPRREDQLFAARHRPWDGDAWDVAVTLWLEDGRHLELRHNLDARTCKAVDADLGTSVSLSEIVHEHVPDGARWLGLDRRAFLATACVRQRDLLGLLDDTAALQAHLQRAAASGGAGGTAADALRLLDRFHHEHVGATHVNAVGPLSRARRRMAAAQAALDDARRQHGEYAGLLARAQALDVEVRQSEHALALVSARRAILDAEVWAGRARLAAGLAAELPDGPPPRTAATDQLALDAAAVLHAWASRPPLPDLAGESAAQLQARLEHADNGDAGARGGAGPGRRTRLASLGAAAALLLLAGTAWAAGQPLAAAAGAAASVAVLLWTVLSTRRGGAREASTAAARSAIRQALAERLRARQALEATATESLRQHQAAGERLRAVAARAIPAIPAIPAFPASLAAAGADTTESRADAHTEALAGALQRWLLDRASEAAALDQARERWMQLQALLQDSTLEALQAEAARRASLARERSRGLDPAAIEATALEMDTEAQLQRLRAVRTEQAEARAQVHGQIAQLSATVSSVPEAEEALEAARQERAAVEDLERILTRTAELLAVAERQAHRDIAPLLQADVERWLPGVTGGRYTQVRVDPAALEIKVQDAAGHWRPASLLSCGTSEQVYLLLRASLARRLATGGEVCPLLLDDVTVHCDGTRTERVLDTLLTLSQERQVVLFTQEIAVRDWAERYLAPPQDRLTCLQPAPAAATVPA